MTTTFAHTNLVAKDWRRLARFISKYSSTPGFSHIAFAVDDVAAVARKVFDHGGTPVGDLTRREVPAVGRLTFQYVADPEGNILEIQNWRGLPE